LSDDQSSAVDYVKETCCYNNWHSCWQWQLAGVYLAKKFSKLTVPKLGYTQTSHWSGISAGKNYWVECYILVSQALLLSHPLCSPACQSKWASSDNQRSAYRTTHPNNPAVEALRRPWCWLL